MFSQKVKHWLDGKRQECGDKMRPSTDSHGVSVGFGVGNHRCKKGWNREVVRHSTFSLEDKLRHIEE